MSVALALFQSCSPADEFFDYPLYFPKPNYRGKPPPMQSAAAEANSIEKSESFRAKEAQKAEEARREEEAKKAVPKPNVQLQKFKEVSGGADIMPASKAADLSRILGFAPSQADIAALHATAGDNVGFDAFMEWNLKYCAPHKAADTPSELCAFFKEFDKQGTGILTTAQVRTILSRYGEALTDAEIDVIFQELDIKGDTVDYNAFIQRLLSEDLI